MLSNFVIQIPLLTSYANGISLQPLARFISKAISLVNRFFAEKSDHKNDFIDIHLFSGYNMQPFAVAIAKP
jgi:hypothetical protein